MRINLRHGATAVILAAAFSVLGSAAANAAVIPGAPAANLPQQGLLPPPNRCHEWDWWKYDSCRHDSNQCTFRVTRVYHDRYGRYNEEGYYRCTQYPKPTPRGQR